MGHLRHVIRRILGLQISVAVRVFKHQGGRGEERIRRVQIDRRGRGQPHGVGQLQYAELVGGHVRVLLEVHLAVQPVNELSRCAVRGFEFQDRHIGRVAAGKGAMAL